MCPQMIFSEASVALETWLRKRVTKKFSTWKPPRASACARGLFYAVLAVGSVLLAFIFICYFVEPRDLCRRLASLDIHTAAGISGAAVTLVTFLDFTLVRQRFCTTVCPYGYLQGLLGDGNTLLVHYRDETHDVHRVQEVRARLPHGNRYPRIALPDRVHPLRRVHRCLRRNHGAAQEARPDSLRVGREGRTACRHDAAPWYRRVGLRDAKRVVVLLVLLFYASGLFVALGDAPRRAGAGVAGARDALPHRRRRPHLQPVPLPHRQPRQQAARGGLLDPAICPERQLAMAAESRARAARRIRARRVRNLRPAGRRDELVSHFSILTNTVPDGESDAIPMTFLAPTEGK